MKYNEFRILVKDQKTRLVTPSKEMPPDIFEVTEDPLLKKVIKIFRKWLAEEDNKLWAGEDVEIFGSILFNTIFNDKMARDFIQEYDKIRRDKDTTLRVILEFKKEASDLAIWPWEYMYYPDSERGKGFFLAADDQIVLVRQVSIRIDDLKKSKNLNILIIKSTPTKSDNDAEDDPGTILSEEVIEKIGDLKSSIAEEVNIEILESPTKKKLVDIVKKFYDQGNQFNIVHFIGHGKYVPSNQKTMKEGGYLGFTKEEDDKVISWISDDAFAECFKNREPRLIFLHACEGAASQSYASFRGMALQLVFSRIPGVVAMQYPIKNGVAINFAEKFYEALSKGKDIDVAVQSGRNAIGLYTDETHNYTNRDFGSPVVYLHRADGIVIADEKPPDLVSVDTTTVKNVCPHCKYPVQIGQKRCSNSNCRHILDSCPKCKKIYSKTLAYCIFCDYEEKDGGLADPGTSRDIPPDRKLVDRIDIPEISKIKDDRNSSQGSRNIN